MIKIPIQHILQLDPTCTKGEHRVGQPLYRLRRLGNSLSKRPHGVKMGDMGAFNGAPLLGSEDWSHNDWPLLVSP